MAEFADGRGGSGVAVTLVVECKRVHGLAIDNTAPMATAPVEAGLAASSYRPT